jgi:hypothetical protein
MKVSMAIAVAAALLLAACGSGGVSGSGHSGAAASSPTPTPALSAPFTLEDGFEHDVCGIGLIVRFIPPTSTSSTASEAVLEWGPVSNVQDNVQDHTGDQPLPANGAQLVAGQTATLDGKSFRVLGVDTAGSSVQLQPLC